MITTWFFRRVADTLFTYLLFLQHLGLVVVFGLTYLPAWILYKIRGSHERLSRFYRVWLWLYFAFNSVFIRRQARIVNARGTVILFAYEDPIEYLVCFTGLGYRKLIVVPPGFTSQVSRLRYANCPLFFVMRAIIRSVSETDHAFLTQFMGYCEPQPFSIHDYQTTPFFVEPYVAAGFNLIEGARARLGAHAPIPFALMIAIKHHLPVMLIKIKGKDRIPFASFATPAGMSFSIEKTIPASDDRAVYLEAYQQWIQMQESPVETPIIDQLTASGR